MSNRKQEGWRTDGRGTWSSPAGLEDTGQSPMGAGSSEGLAIVSGSDPLCMFDLVATEGTLYVTKKDLASALACRPLLVGAKVNTVGLILLFPLCCWRGNGRTWRKRQIM